MILPPFKGSFIQKKVFFIAFQVRLLWTHILVLAVNYFYHSACDTTDHSGSRSRSIETLLHAHLWPGRGLATAAGQLCVYDLSNVIKALNSIEENLCQKTRTWWLTAISTPSFSAHAFFFLIFFVISLRIYEYESILNK